MKIHSLNDKIWNSDNTLKTEIRKNLLQICKDFLIFVKIKNLKIIDIILTGSLANFNWHDKSDLDVHILIDLNNFKKYKNFVEEYLQSKKQLWNTSHKINIYGFPVEMYPEDISKNQKSSGSFSLIKNEWIVMPIYKEKFIDKNLVKQKYENEVNNILNIESMINKNKFGYRYIINLIDKLKDRLRQQRAESIKKYGEMTIDNLVYKMLRKNGFLQKLSDLKTNIYDKAISINNLSEIYNKFFKDEKYIVKKDLPMIHSKKDDKIKIIESSDFNIKYRNLRNRKDYNIDKDEFFKIVSNNFVNKV